MCLFGLSRYILSGDLLLKESQTAIVTSHQNYNIHLSFIVSPGCDLAQFIQYAITVQLGEVF